MENYRLELKNVSKYFGEVKALENINFQLGQNEIVGLLGDNGAGKSTLIKIITGYHQPTSGEIYFNGKKVDNLTVPKARELGVETVYFPGT
jgi:simple sugar transport system ATP-binding protein